LSTFFLRPTRGSRFFCALRGKNALPERSKTPVQPGAAATAESGFIQRPENGAVSVTHQPLRPVNAAPSLPLPFSAVFSAGAVQYEARATGADNTAATDARLFVTYRF